MDNYYDVVDDIYIPGRWHLYDPINDEGCDPYDFTAGKPARILSKPDIEVQVPGTALDFTLTAFAVPVASRSLAEAFGQIAGTDLQRIPVRVGSREDYEILVATRRVQCLDEQRSDFIKWTEADGRPDRIGQYRSVPKIRLNATLIPPGTHAFRLEGWRVVLIVSREMMEAAKAINAVGPKFRPVG